MKGEQKMKDKPYRYHLKRKGRLAAVLLALLLCAGSALAMTGCSAEDALDALNQAEKLFSIEGETVTVEELPEYDGHPYIAVNDNMPDFDEDDLTEDSFEMYSDLDSLGRCGVCYANVGQDLMPTEKRGSIGSVKPTGWVTSKYDFVDGKYLYNRCHLLGYQLTAENANERNLITGTRYMNTEGMLPFENLVADYVRESGGHVLYRVTPVFYGDELVARGVQMEGFSVEDKGASVCFNVFVYNVQPGVTIDYADGSNQASASKDVSQSAEGEIRGNSRSKVYHCPGQRAYDDMADSKNLVVFSSEEEAQEAGYRRTQQ